MEYQNSKTEETKQVIEDILEQQHNQVQICTLTPASILKYNAKGVAEGDTEKQKLLVQNIEELNYFIISKNIQRDLSTIDLARQSYKASLKK